MASSLSQITAANGKRKATGSNVEGQFDDPEGDSSPLKCSDKAAYLKTHAANSGGNKADAISAIHCLASQTEASSDTPPKKKTKPAAAAHKPKAAAVKKPEDPPETLKAAVGAAAAAATAGLGSSLSDYEKCSIFPQKLHQLLKNNEAPDAIWWLEDGESFAIEPEKFTKVMNKVSRTTKKQVKLDSILRNLYRWGFKKLKDGRNKWDRKLPANVLAYSHPKFKRDAIEMHNFSKNPDPTPASPSATDPQPSALARALSARAQAGYGNEWNSDAAASQVAAASQMPIMQGSVLSQQLPYYDSPHQMNPQMQMYHHQRQQQLLLEQKMLLHQERQRHEQALLLEAAAAERAAAQEYAAQRYAAAMSNYRPDPSAAMGFTDSSMYNQY